MSLIHRQTSLFCLALAIAITSVFWPSHLGACRTAIWSPRSTLPHNSIHLGASSDWVPSSPHWGCFVPTIGVMSVGYLPFGMYEVPCKTGSPLDIATRRVWDHTTADYIEPHSAHSTPPTHSSHSPPDTDTARHVAGGVRVGLPRFVAWCHKVVDYISGCWC